jgi:predicted outer membrane repeat protein
LGGGIYNYSGALKLTNIVVSDNSSTVGGGGIYNDGTLMLNNSTVSDNSADAGGGVYNASARTLTMTNSTVSGNSARLHGGGIYNSSTLSLTNSTVSGNTAQSGSGGIYNGNAGALSMTNATLAGNSSPDLRNNNPGNPQLTAELTNTIVQSCFGAVTDNGGNLDGGSACGLTAATSVSNATLDLGALADNGGPTLTMLPGASSDAFGNGLLTVCAAPPVNGLDQRGFTRSTVACSSGAVEHLFALTVSVTGNGSVSEDPAGLIDDCTATTGICSGTYTVGASVNLVATPAPGYDFDGWSGNCSGLLRETAVVMSEHRACTAQFTAQPQPYAITQPVPTLDRWVLLLLGLLATGVAFRRLGGRKQS